jgi:hypothetical protein
LVYLRLRLFFFDPCTRIRSLSSATFLPGEGDNAYNAEAEAAREVVNHGSAPVMRLIV